MGIAPHFEKHHGHALQVIKLAIGIDHNDTSNTNNPEFIALMRFAYDKASKNKPPKWLVTMDILGTAHVMPKSFLKWLWGTGRCVHLKDRAVFLKRAVETEARKNETCCEVRLATEKLEATERAEVTVDRIFKEEGFILEAGA